jgi:hypothetical protein
MERNERGQALPLLALVIVVGGVAMLALGRIGGAAVERARASAAADAAALAGAAEGRDAARGVTAANEGRIVRYEVLGDDVRARVAVGEAEATARARRTSGAPLAVPPGREGASPAVLAALARADQVLGGRVVVTAVHPDGLEVSVASVWAGPLAAAGAGLCQAGPDPLRFGICA